MKSVIIILALLCFVSFPNPTVSLTKKPWPNPSDLANHNSNFGESKASWACSSSSDPNAPPLPPGSFPTIPKIPGIPNIPIPNIPNIPGLPNIPGIPNPPFHSLLVSQSGELEKCLSKDGSKTNEKCFSQIFSSWAENDLVLDKECCEIVVNMNKRCYGHLHMMFKSYFFAPLLQYSCHIKHAKN